MRYKIRNIPRFLNHTSIKTAIMEELHLEKGDIKLLYKPNQDYGIIVLKSPIDAREIKIHNSLCKITPTSTKSRETQPRDVQIDIRDQVTPLWKQSYAEQIARKKGEIESFYKKPVKYHTTEQFYRNNCQFGVGFDLLNNPIVGFRAKYTKDYPNIVYDIRECVNVSPGMKKTVDGIVAALLPNPDLVFDAKTKCGFLRNIMIRECGEESIVLIQINDDGVIEGTFGTDLFDIEYLKLAGFLRELKIENLHIQFQSSVMNGFMPTRLYHISGIRFLTEKIGDFSFEISYFTFFQVNVDASIKICQAIIDKGFRNKVLLDLCCGSGFFGIMMSPFFDRIVGIEIDKECINQAHRNIENNKILNYTVKMADVESEVFNEDCTVILDPPRSGVSKKTIQNLRMNGGISEIFFICCAYKNSHQNIVDLCKEESKRYRNGPFVVKEIEAFDMFPYTEKSEILIHLVRERKLN